MSNTNNDIKPLLRVIQSLINRLPEECLNKWVKVGIEDVEREVNRLGIYSTKEEQNERNRNKL